MGSRYALEDLLSIRGIREQNAASDLRIKRHELEVCQDTVRKSQRAKEDYVAWRILEERRLYDASKGKHLSLRDLDMLKHKVLGMRGRDLSYEKAVDDARIAATQASERLDSARSVHVEARRKVQKIEEHKLSWSKLVTKAAERNEEKEMEDFRVRMLQMEADDS